MAEAPLRNEDDAPDPVAPEATSHTAFDFFRGCQNSPHPDWGQNVIRFSLPNSPTPISKKGATSKIIKFPGRFLGT